MSREYLLIVEAPRGIKPLSTDPYSVVLFIERRGQIVREAEMRIRTSISPAYETGVEPLYSSAIVQMHQILVY